MTNTNSVFKENLITKKWIGFMILPFIFIILCRSRRVAGKAPAKELLRLYPAKCLYKTPVYKVVTPVSIRAIMSEISAVFRIVIAAGIGCLAVQVFVTFLLWYNPI